MTQRTANPWLPTSDDQAPATSTPAQPTPASAPPAVATTGATAPQKWVTPPEAADQLASFATTERPPLWIIGTHGGAGESTLARLLNARETGHRWPAASDPAPVLLAARTSAHGLDTAQHAMRGWASRQVPAVRLLGLVLIADAPGRLPRPLAERAEILRGGVPHLWHLPWLDDVRLGAPEPHLGRAVGKTLNEIDLVLNTTV